MGSVEPIEQRGVLTIEQMTDAIHGSGDAGVA
jgi:hypothetical protein